MNFQEKFTFLITLAVFPAAFSPIFFTYGARSTLDGNCLFSMPTWSVLLMACVDFVLSGSYLHLFLKPLREMINSNNLHRTPTAHHASRRVAHAASESFPAAMIFTLDVQPVAGAAAAVTMTPATRHHRPLSLRTPLHPSNSNALSLPSPSFGSTSLSSPTSAGTIEIITSDAAATAGQIPTPLQLPPPPPLPPPSPPLPPSTVPLSAATRSAKELQKIMRKNMKSCCAAIAVTMINLTFILTSHLLDNATLYQLQFTIGNTDLVITVFVLFYLMAAPTVKPTAGRIGR